MKGTQEPQFGEGRGSNKKEAEKAAAKDALGKIKKQDIS
ncbi:putative dsRNA-binding protein [Calothrix rhizosoleniae]|nr:putative dsRNA-binding protein [Calothrix rhizosoleniae]